MKEIELTQGKFTQVDDEDYEYLSQWKWYAFNHGNTFYAVRHISSKDNLIFMHRVIMQVNSKLLTDHKDHNGLNNQKYNLRECNASQNQMNVTPYGETGYLGVVYLRKGKYKYIQAYITIDQKRKSLGNYKTLEEAATARDKAAIKYHGEFANLNFK